MITLTALFAEAQIIVPEKKISLPAIMQETSGLEMLCDSILITHNDSGNDAVLYFLNTEGKLKNKISLPNTQNIDWEDLATDGKDVLWISDLGNNSNTRENLMIHQFHLKDSSEKSISVKYADQKFPVQDKNHNYDSEAMIYANNQLYIFTKNNSTPYNGTCKVYKINPEEKEQIVPPTDSINLGNEGYWKNSVTSADLSDDGKTLAILTYGYLFFFFDYTQDHFFEGKYIRFILPEMQQREAIVFDKDNNIYMTDENSRLSNGGYLYFYDLNKLLSGYFYFREPEVKKIKLKKKKEIPFAIRREFFTIKIKLQKKENISVEYLVDGKRTGIEEKGMFKKIKVASNITNRDAKSVYSYRVYSNNKLIYSDIFPNTIY